MHCCLHYRRILVPTTNNEPNCHITFVIVTFVNQLCNNATAPYLKGAARIQNVFVAVVWLFPYSPISVMRVYTRILLRIFLIDEIVDKIRSVWR